MRSQLDSSEDSCRTVGTSDDTQRSSFLGSKAHQNRYQQYGKDTQLSSRTENRQTKITQHRTKIGQCTYSHEYNRRKESRLNQHIINEVHQSQFMCNFMKRHFPDVLHHTVHHDHSIFIGLHYPHITAREVGQQHPESDGYQQQRFVLLLDTQIEQDESNGIHDEKPRVSSNVAESGHII